MRPTTLVPLFVAMLLLGTASFARADGDSELDRIPATPAPTACGTTPTPRPVNNERTYIEDAFTQSALRSSVVPYPSPLPPAWENRTSLDTLDQWSVSRRITAFFSDRFNIIEDDRFGFASNQALRNDLREAYLSAQLGSQTFLEAGRINIRNGVALGFNPTDFFKAGTLVEQASLDPSVIREDRLGTFMVHAQTIWNGGSADVSFAPKLSAPTPISFIPKSGLDPGTGKTNADARFELTASAKIADLSPQVLFYSGDGETKYGLNVSRGFGQNTVAYAEWAGGSQQDLIARAISFAKGVGTLPPTAPIVPPTDPSRTFRNDLSIGASLTAAEITLNMEYHYHQAGFSARDWQNWFAIGQSPSSSTVANELWVIRGYAQQQQEPMAQQELFLRVDRPNAFVANLELTAFAFVSLHDGSVLSQIAATYALSSRWILAAYVGANTGGPYSERGVIPQSFNAIVQAIRYL
jgi:hypothetical protein